MKKLLLHYNFMKESLSKEPKTTKLLAEEMKAEFDVNYQYVLREVNQLVSLKKIKKVNHNMEILLLWTEETVKFEYELSNNVIQLDKQFMVFDTVPSKVRQMKLPLFIWDALNNKIVNLSEKIELMLELKAIKSNGVWYKIKRSEKKNG